jgi:hypothetical protein
MSSESSSESLTSSEMNKLLIAAGSRCREHVSDVAILGDELNHFKETLLRLHGHVISDRIETAKVAEAGSYIWEWQAQSNNSWSPLDAVDQVVFSPCRRSSSHSSLICYLFFFFFFFSFSHL